MPIEFQIPTLRVQATKTLDEFQSEQSRKTTLLLLEEDRIQAMAASEQKQRQTEAFVDHHHRQIDKQLAIGKPVLIFQTKMGLMTGKLQFRWTGPYWIVVSKNGTYQVGTLAGNKAPKWNNCFRLKPYQGEMPENSFRTEDTDMARDHVEKKKTRQTNLGVNTN